MSTATRSGDPWTSRAAEREHTDSGKRQTQAELVLEHARRSPGLTGTMLGLRTGLGQVPTVRRFNDLRQKGLVRQGEARKGLHRTSEVTWWAEDQQGRLMI